MYFPLRLLGFGRPGRIGGGAFARLRLAFSQILAQRCGEPLPARLAGAGSSFAESGTWFDAGHRALNVLTGARAVKTEAWRPILAKLRPDVVLARASGAETLP